MYPVSEKYLDAIQSNDRTKSIKMHIDTAFESFDFSDADILKGSVKIEESAISGDTFGPGGVCAANLSVTLLNTDGRFDDCQFNGARISAYDGTELSDGTVEWVPLGVFSIDDVSRPTTTVTIQAADNMTYLDKSFSGVQITFPATCLQIAEAICFYCGLTLASSDFDGCGYTVKESPGSDMSCRDILSDICEISGGFARCGRANGNIEIVPFVNPGCVTECEADGGNFISDDHTLSGSAVEYNVQNEAIINSLSVAGSTLQDGSGNASPDNVRAIHGVTKIAVNSKDYSLPQTLYALSDSVSDSYDLVNGSGTQKIGCYVLDGSNMALCSSVSSGSTVYFTDHNVNSLNCHVLCNRFVCTDPDDLWLTDAEGICIDDTDGGLRLRISKLRLPGWSDSLTDEQKIAAFKSWLSSNSVTVLYELTAPQNISGTAQRILTDGHTTISSDCGGQISVSYSIMDGDNVSGGNFGWWDNRYRCGGVFNEPLPSVSLFPDNRYSFQIDDSPITVTGVELEASDNTYLVGSDYYEIRLSDNQLIQENKDQVINSIFDRFYNFSFLPFTSSWQGNPAVQPGDVIKQTDRKGVTYLTVVTGTDYVYRGTCEISAKGASKTSSGYQAQSTKQYSQIQRQISEKQLQISNVTTETENAVKVIAGALGGYFIDGNTLSDEKYHNKFFVSDQSDISKAVKVWRWDINGFGFSQNGVDGSYNSAISPESTIIAGIITAEMLKSGTLESKNKATWINLDDGSFSLGNGSASYDDNSGFNAVSAEKIKSPDSKASAEITKVDSGLDGLSVRYAQQSVITAAPTKVETQSDGTEKIDACAVTLGTKDSSLDISVAGTDSGDNAVLKYSGGGNSQISFGAGGILIGENADGPRIYSDDSGNLLINETKTYTGDVSWDKAAEQKLRCMSKTVS